MSPTRSLTVTLPLDLAEQVEAKVAAGDYANESEVVRDGISMLLEQGAEVESWLSHDVATTYDAYKRDPSRAIPADEMLSRLEQLFAADADAERGA